MTIVPLSFQKNYHLFDRIHLASTFHQGHFSQSHWEKREGRKEKKVEESQSEGRDSKGNRFSLRSLITWNKNQSLIEYDLYIHRIVVLCLCFGLVWSKASTIRISYGYTVSFSPAEIAKVRLVQFGILSPKEIVISLSFILFFHVWLLRKSKKKRKIWNFCLFGFVGRGQRQWCRSRNRAPTG